MNRLGPEPTTLPPLLPSAAAVPIAGVPTFMPINRPDPAVRTPGMPDEPLWDSSRHSSTASALQSGDIGSLIQPSALARQAGAAGFPAHDRRHIRSEVAAGWHPPSSDAAQLLESAFAVGAGAHEFGDLSPPAFDEPYWVAEDIAARWHASTL